MKLGRAFWLPDRMSSCQPDICIPDMTDEGLTNSRSALVM
jgi:hypothetical protein